MDDYLESNFAHQGESYFKGYGHLLREDMAKGLFYVSLMSFVPVLMLSFFFFQLLEKESQLIAYKIMRILALLVLALTLLYAFDKISEFRIGDTRQDARVIEISTTWILRVAGFFCGYSLLKTVKKNNKFS